MKKSDLIFICLSMIVALCSYLTTNIIYIPLGIFVIYVAYYFIFLRRKIKNYFVRAERIHCCYHFINSFLITLSVKESFEDAYQNGIRLSNKELEMEVTQIENMPILDRIKYLRRYFNLGIYRMFVNVVGMYQEQGGNIINISDGLMRECTRVEKSLSESIAIGNKHLVEFIILWALAFLIIVFIRFSLADFYFKMIASMEMIAMICGFFILCLLAIHLFIMQFTKLTIKEDVE